MAMPEQYRTFTHDDMKITLWSAKYCIELLGDYKLSLATKAMEANEYNFIIQDLVDLKTMILSNNPDLDVYYDRAIDYYIEIYDLSKSDFIRPDYIKLAQLVREGKIIKPKPIKKRKIDTSITNTNTNVPKNNT